MSWKAVELQIALPKTFEAAKVSDSLLQQPHLQFEAAKSQMEKELMKNRKTVTTSLASEKIGSATKKQGRTGLKGKEAHPFKGNHVDYMG